MAGYLDEDQLEQAERYEGFALHSGARVFWVPLEGTPWCAFADDGRVEHYCIAPDRRGGMPEGDVTLTYLLWIKLDPAGFLREANVLSTRKIEWPDSERELVSALAEIASPPPARPPRPRKKRKKGTPAATRRAGLCLDAEKVEAIFRNHGKEITPELLRKLVPR